jgi:hypothetical protein
MKVKSIKAADKKKEVKAEKVQNINKFAKTAKVPSEKLTLQDIRGIAEKMGVDTRNLNKTELIRSIQRTEGNNDCYASAQVQTCGQMICLWHQDCAMC